jgi:diguanylate cyclase (GGDEF)-like protein
MGGRWLSRRVVARVAVAGLALGLGALVVLTLLGTAATRRATAQVRASNHVTAAWGRVFVQVAGEDEALHRYLATGTDTDRRALLAATGAAQSELTWIAMNCGAVEAFHVRMLRHDYSGYENSLRAIVLAGAQADQSRIDAYVAPADMEFAAVRRQAVANVARTQRNLVAYLAGVDARNSTLEEIAAGVFAVDIALLLLCCAILVGYQWRIERQAASSRYEALHDPLTGLANRVLLRDRAEQALRIAARTGEIVGLLVIDLDGFKQVNDTLGHNAGDLLLREVAEHLTDAVRDSDTVARLGGDEFAVLLPNVRSLRDAADVAGRVLATFAHPVRLSGQPVLVGGSIGVALYPTHAADADHLFRCADVAMYTAKRGRTGVCLYPAGTGAERSMAPISPAGSASP